MIGHMIPKYRFEKLTGLLPRRLIVVPAPKKCFYVILSKRSKLFILDVICRILVRS